MTPGSASKERRYVWMRKALYSVSLPVLTRLVYVILDDHCGQKGRCWYKQSTLATKAGISPRHLRRCIAELQERGLLRVEREARYLVYVMAWADRTPVSYGKKPAEDAHVLCDRTPVSYGKKPAEDAHVLCDRTPVSYQSDPVLITEPQFLNRTTDPQSRPPMCALCGDSGVTGTSGADIAVCACAEGAALENLRRKMA